MNSESNLSAESAMFDEVHALATASLEGTLTTAQTARLEQLVCNDPHARRLLARYLLASSSLRSWAAAYDAEVALETPTAPVALRDELALAPRRPSPLQFAGLVTLSTAAMWLIFFAIFAAHPSREQLAELRGDEPPALARLSGAHQCVWADPTEAPLVGMSFRPGNRLKLRGGLAEITFENGTRVVLRGPAEFQFASGMQALLNRGDLTAHVAQGAEGFTIDTPDLQVIDRGTAFGVAVREGRPSQVAVFEGRVDVAPIAARESETVFSLQAGEKLASRAGHWETARLRTAERRRYVTQLPPRPDRAQPDLLAPVTAGLQLWLAADAGVGQDAQGRVVVWGDLNANARDPHHARQDQPSARPLWVADGANGQPAIRFRGEQYLTTAPFKTGDELTLFAVYALHRRQGDNLLWGGQVFNTNGPPNTALKIFPGGAAGVWVHLGGRHSGNQIARSGPCVPDRWHSCALVYSQKAGRATFWQDGARRAESAASWKIAVDSSKLIGANPRQKESFRGDLGEILVYDRALAAKEVAALELYARQKYHGE